MSQEHDATTMGLLLGMAAAKAGTMDPVVSKMLFMHAPSLSPEAFLELELSPMVQSAALLGLGLLFRGSCHRYTFLQNTHGQQPMHAAEYSRGLKPYVKAAFVCNQAVAAGEGCLLRTG